MTETQKVIKYIAIAFAILLIVGIVGGILQAVGALVSIFGGSEDLVGEMVTYEITGEVKELEIELGAARLEIRAGTEFSLSSDHKYINVSQTGDSLSIREPRRVVHRGESPQVILTLPSDVTLDRIYISTGAGRVSIETLAAERLSFDLGAGEVVIGSLSALTEAEINGGAGQMTVRGGTLRNLDLDMGVGELRLTARLLGDCDLDYGVGEAHLTLLGDKSDYRIELEKGIGSATVDGVTVSGGIYGDGPCHVEINGGVGAITVSFRADTND